MKKLSMQEEEIHIISVKFCWYVSSIFPLKIKILIIAEIIICCFCKLNNKNKKCAIMFSVVYYFRLTKVHIMVYSLQTKSENIKFPRPWQQDDLIFCQQCICIMVLLGNQNIHHSSQINTHKVVGNKKKIKKSTGCP